MTGPTRLETGGRAIDRAQPLRFTFDGRAYSGFAGDTLASALLANGVRIVGRSFKYHRPRGIYGAGVEEPNALVDVTLGERTRPNLQATTVPLTDRLVARSVNASPTAEADRFAVIDRFAKFLPAGFYYKTFLWPNWHLFEPRIRAMAGLGRLGPTPSDMRADQVHRSVDLLVVGAGPAGLCAALAANAAGRSVMIVDDGPAPGGALHAHDQTIEGSPGPVWAAEVAQRLQDAGATLLTRSTAFGVYDHGLVGVLEREAVDAPGWAPERLHLVRARQIVLAAGAIERPLVFPDNDRPGVMSAQAVQAYLTRWGVLPGRRIVVATNNDSAYPVASSLVRAGATVTVVDYRPRVTPTIADETRAMGVTLRIGERIEGVMGTRAVTGVQVGATLIAADCLAMSGGFTPTVHLHCQARGKLRYDGRLAALVPGDLAPGMLVAGAANGAFDLQSCVFEGHAAGGGAMGRSPRVTSRGETFGIEPAWPEPGLSRRAWIDFQNDVTTKDVELAARENYRSVEHLKRYTTLGMATDQGKTANMNALALMAAITDRSIPEVGTTTYRPPFTPVPFSAIVGMRRGTLMDPLKRLPAENAHRRLGARLDAYGGWLRPRCYGGGPDEAAAIRAEVMAARGQVGLFDASSLGKIEVLGPDAARFLDFIYYNTVSTLKPGRIRYGFMLRENGVVYDDGVLARLAEDRFLVSCSSGHTAGVLAALESWRHDSFDTRRVVIHDLTAGWGTIAVSGPRSRRLVEALGLGVDLDDAALPHMSLAAGLFAGRVARVARVSFTGDRSYEISVPASLTARLWQALVEAGAPLGATPFGLEALSLMRAEKGYIIVGRDTDGTTMPHDLGMTGPRDKRRDEFVGRRSLFLEAAQAGNRRQLVGLAAEGDEPLGNGAHAAYLAGERPRSIGYVTTSYFSPTLGRPIALGLVENGRARLGDIIDIHHLGSRRRARIVEPCFLDPKGERLDA